MAVDYVYFIDFYLILPYFIQVGYSNFRFASFLL